LRAGTIALSKAQVESALKELSRVTKNDVQSTPTVTVADGNPAKISFGTRPFSESEDNGVKVSVGGVEQVFRAREVGVSLEFTPHVLADGAVQVDVDIEVIAFEGFVEYGGTQAVVPTKTGLSGEVLESITVKVPTGFYQPIFSNSSVRRELRISKGAVIVLLAEPVKNYEPSLDKEGFQKPLLGRVGSRSETWLIFLTAEVVPTKR
jgi:general secretion pathway protein D